MASLSADWDAFLQARPQAHLLQTTAWGALKSAYGWQAQALCTDVPPTGGQAAGALILFRRLPLGLTLAYIPRGPLADWKNPAALRELLREVDRACRARRAVLLKMEPDLPDEPAWPDRLTDLGFHLSPHTVQPRRTLLVDLSGDEAAILGRMKPKTRYNIGLAAKKGVSVRPAAGTVDVAAFNQLMAVTGTRDGFGVHAPGYYARALELFQPAGRADGEAALFLAEFQGQALAGVMAFTRGPRAWYFYGASSDHERNRMAPYLAQWAAMQWARARGAQVYDLWGIPDEPPETLEAQFESRRDGLWGVYRFKRGFGGQMWRSVGAWDRVYQPVLYQAYRAYLRLRRRGVE